MTGFNTILSTGWQPQHVSAAGAANYQSLIIYLHLRDTCSRSAHVLCWYIVALFLDTQTKTVYTDEFWFRQAVAKVDACDVQ